MALFRLFGQTPASTTPSIEKPLSSEPTPPPAQHNTEQPQHLQLAPDSQPRPNRSLLLLAGGITFFTLSTLITRRSLARRKLSTLPPYYTTASLHKPRVNGAVEALEALNIATINVVSVAMVTTGAGLWFFDINSLADMRRKVRGGLGVDGTGRSEEDAEEEFEEWIVSTLARKERKEEARRARGEGVEGVLKNERGQER